MVLVVLGCYIFSVGNELALLVFLAFAIAWSVTVGAVVVVDDIVSVESVLTLWFRLDRLGHR